MIPQDVMDEVVLLVPDDRMPAFWHFVETGEADDAFLAFLHGDKNAQKACELVLRSDREVAWLIRMAGPGR